MRVKRGFAKHQKHKKLHELTAGYRMSKHRLIKVAKEASLHAAEYAYAGRKNKKREFRRFFISRIESALTGLGVSYSRFMANLKKASINLDRKTLAELAVSDFASFKKVVEKAQQ
jgi:large subunit ribosomal protein L20